MSLLNSVGVRWLLYIAIAGLTALMSDLHNFKDGASSFEITSLICNCLLQCLIAWRAFIDQSISNQLTNAKEEASPLVGNLKVEKLNTLTEENIKSEAMQV